MLVSLLSCLVSLPSRRYWSYLLSLLFHLLVWLFCWLCCSSSCCRYVGMLRWLFLLLQVVSCLLRCVTSPVVWWSSVGVMILLLVVVFDVVICLCFSQRRDNVCSHLDVMWWCKGCWVDVIMLQRLCQLVIVFLLSLLVYFFFIVSCVVGLLSWSLHLCVVTSLSRWVHLVLSVLPL